MPKSLDGDKELSGDENSGSSEEELSERSSSSDQHVPISRTPMTPYPGKQPTTDWVEILMFKLKVRT